MDNLKAEFGRVDAKKHQAPIDIKLQDSEPTEGLSPLQFQGYGNTPTKMKLNNTGYTVTVSGKFDGGAPSISGGPLEEQYNFTQLHFHWGPTETKGSEHTFDGRRLPMEMHIVHINKKYDHQEEALLQRDGVALVAFIFVIGRRNEGLDAILRDIKEVEEPHTSFKIPPRALGSFCPPFTEDYFVYWGSVISPSCEHLIQWIICRTPLEASADQIAAFRQIKNVNGEPLLRNYRDEQPMGDRAVYHCSPGDRSGFGLHCSASKGEIATKKPGETSALSVEGPCTSLEEAESRGKIDPGAGTEGLAGEDGLEEGSQAVGGAVAGDSEVEKKPSQGSQVEKGPSRGSQAGADGGEGELAAGGGEEGMGGEGGPDGAAAGGGADAMGGEAGAGAGPGEAGAEAGAGAGPGESRRDKSTVGSRAGSFSNLTGPIKDRSSDEWPDAPYKGTHLAAPIDIAPGDAVRMVLPPLVFNGHFAKDVGLALTNSGETVEISLLKITDRPVLTGGPLEGRYILDAAHFHWVLTDDAQNGTHILNNTRADIECHMVHINEKYKSKTEAKEHPNGLAMCSFLLQVGGSECDSLSRICNALPKIAELYTTVELPGADLSWIECAAQPHNYFTYPGRFFGREDGQALVWIVCATPINICCQNVNAFQKLKVVNEFRPHQTYPLGDRPLIAAISKDPSASRKSGGDGMEDEYGVGGTRRTPSGKVQALADGEWPNSPFKSKSGQILMSPLDIMTSSVPCIPFTPLEYRGHFDIANVPIELRNTGEAVDLKWKYPGAPPTLLGGPLPDEYEFDSAHFHWAQNPEDVGAMHRINGKRCDLECHLVHFRKSMGTRQNAMYENEGLAVCSFLLTVGGEENASFAQLSDALQKIREVDAVTEIKADLNWLKTRAGPHGFFTYPGALFGADQGVNIIWIVYPTPVQICCQHIGQFYKMDSLDYDRMHDLYQILDRPIYYAINADSCAI